MHIACLKACTGKTGFGKDLVIFSELKEEMIPFFSVVAELAGSRGLKLPA